MSYIEHQVGVDFFGVYQGRRISLLGSLSGANDKTTKGSEQSTSTSSRPPLTLTSHGTAVTQGASNPVLALAEGGEGFPRQFPILGGAGGLGRRSNTIY